MGTSWLTQSTIQIGAQNDRQRMESRSQQEGEVTDIGLSKFKLEVTMNYHVTNEQKNLKNHTERNYYEDLSLLQQKA